VRSEDETQGDVNRTKFLSLSFMSSGHCLRSNSFLESAFRSAQEKYTNVAGLAML
jgi:hypothetical protein